MSEKIEPCPFCGGEAHVYKNNLWHVACERAHNCCVTMSAFATEAEAIDAWNTRHVETCELEYISDFMSWHCKACDMMDMAPRDPKPRYCKWCGRKDEE